MLLVLLRIAMARWNNRARHLFHLSHRILAAGRAPTPHRTFFSSLYTFVLTVILLATGFSLANTAILGPADEVAYVTDNANKTVIDYRAYLSLSKIQDDLIFIHQNESHIKNANEAEGQLMGAAYEVCASEANLRVAAGGEKQKIAAELFKNFRLQGRDGFAFFHFGLFALRQEVWPKTEAGQILFSQVLSLILILLPVSLVFLHLGVINRELGQVEWSFEWLFTFPVPARVLFLGRLLAWLVNPTLWFFIYPFITLVDIAAGFKAWSLLVAIPATLYIGVVSGSVSIVMEILLRKFLPLSKLKNAQALFTILGALTVFAYLTISASRPTIELIIEHRAFITFPLAWLPTSLPLIWAQPTASVTQLLIATGAMLLFAALAAQLSTRVCDLLTRDGLMQSSSSFAAALGSARQRRALQISYKPGWGVWSVEAKLLRRDRNLLIQVLICPLLVVGYYLCSSANLLAAAAVNYQHGCALAYGISAYILLNSALPILHREQNGLWLLSTFPRDLTRILFQKSTAWSAFAAIYATLALIGLACINHHLSLSSIFDASVTLFGVIMYAYIAGGIGVLSTSLQEEKGSLFRMRADMIYLYIFLASLFITAIYSTPWGPRLTQILLTILLTQALWKRVAQVTPYILDPVAAPPQSLHLFDCYIALVFFFSTKQTVLSYFFHFQKISYLCLLPQGWATLIAGLVATSALAISLSIRRISLFPPIPHDRRALPSSTLSPLKHLATAVITSALAIGLSLVDFHLFPAPLPLGPGDEDTSGSLMSPYSPFVIQSLAYLPASLLLLTPLLEGFLIRQLLLNRLLAASPPGLALLQSAFIASLLLAYSPGHFIPQFIIALITGITYLVTKRLWPSILTHYIYNVTLFSLLGPSAM